MKVEQSTWSTLSVLAVATLGIVGLFFEPTITILVLVASIILLRWEERLGWYIDVGCPYCGNANRFWCPDIRADSRGAYAPCRRCRWDSAWMAR